MAFYSPDAPMGQRLSALAAQLERRLPGVGGLAITWLRFRGPGLASDATPVEAPAPELPLIARSRESLRPWGASWHGERLQDPGGLVALPYLLAAEQWLLQGLLPEEPELRRAMAAIVQGGSCDGLSFLVDRLSGTTSGPPLPPHLLGPWQRQRALVNGWLACLGWPELQGFQACQKLWQEGPYGRERQFLTAANANRCSSDGLARLLAGVIEGSLLSPPACQRLRSLLRRDGNGPGSPSPGAALQPGGLPLRNGWWHRHPGQQARVWGLEGCSGTGVQQALYLEPGPVQEQGRSARVQEPQLLVVLSEGGGEAWTEPALADLERGLLDWRPGPAAGLSD